MKIIIGIISWLPDDQEIRKVRLDRLKKLIIRCRQNFELPIMIIAQNYNGDEFKEYPWLNIFYYDKLGITGARRELRKKFLESAYDYVICLDDDFELNPNKAGADQYLKNIHMRPNFFFEYENYLMNLCAISRWIFEKVDYDENISAENGTGFEDWIFVSVIRKKYPNHYLKLSNLRLPAKSRRELVGDKYSTWQTGDEDKDAITEKSRKIINAKINER